MTTSFTELPIVDLAPLQGTPSEAELEALATRLYTVFSTVGFAYLKNAPLSVPEDEVFGLAREFFEQPLEEKMKLAKTTFCPNHRNTYRGYFPAQPGADNLKEGFEVGPSAPRRRSSVASSSPFVLTEPNVFPPAERFSQRGKCETLYADLQALSQTLLQLLATSLGYSSTHFTSLLAESISTLRLLHYPSRSRPSTQELCCTPHTDSGLLTLLHQDSTGGLEVQNSAGDWIPAPYTRGTLVVNIGDLMAQMSRGRFVATRHRVRAGQNARYSVPFFCEPGVAARVGEPGREMRYEQFVLGKMGTWVEFQSTNEHEPMLDQGLGVQMEVGA